MKQLRKDGVRRRRFLKAVPAAVAGGLAVPALAQPPAQEQARRISKDMLECGEKIFGVDFSDAEEEQALAGVNRNLDSYEQLRAIDVPLDTEPAVTFRPYLPGKKPKPGATPGAKIKVTLQAPVGAQRVARRPRVPSGHGARAARSAPRGLVDRPDEDVPRPAQEVRAEAELRRHAHRGAGARAGGAGRQGDPRRQVPRTAARHPLGRQGSLRDQGHPHDVGRGPVSEPGLRLRRDDRRAAARRRRGARRQALDGRAGAGRPLVPRTDEERRGTPRTASSGSSAGPGSATAAGLVGFSIGTETRGSIISPSAVNGVTGLRPTYGRVSRHGAMALSWTMDKIGPMCRSIEDCALVFNAIYGPDGRDDTVVDAPFALESRRAALEAQDRLHQVGVRGRRRPTAERTRRRTQAAAAPAEDAATGAAAAACHRKNSGGGPKSG